MGVQGCQPCAHRFHHHPHPRADAVRIYADGSVRPDIDPDSVAVDSAVRYVFAFRWRVMC